MERVRAQLRACRPRSRPRGAVRPGRRLASVQARDAVGRARRRRDAGLLRPADRRRRRQRALADLLDRPGGDVERPRRRASDQRRHRRGVSRAPRGPRRGAAVPGRARRLLPRPLAGRVRPGPRRAGLRRPGAGRLRPARRQRRRLVAAPPSRRALQRRAAGRPRRTRPRAPSRAPAAVGAHAARARAADRAAQGAARWSARRAPACHGWRPARCASSCARGARSRRGGGRCAARCGGEGAPRGTASRPGPPRARRRRRRRGSGTASGGRRRGPCGPRRSGPRCRPGRPAWWPCPAAS